MVFISMSKRSLIFPSRVVTLKMTHALGQNTNPKLFFWTRTEEEHMPMRCIHEKKNFEEIFLKPP